MISLQSYPPRPRWHRFLRETVWTVGHPVRAWRIRQARLELQPERVR